jgi:hypothetical protein
MSGRTSCSADIQIVSCLKSARKHAVMFNALMTHRGVLLLEHAFHRHDRGDDVLNHVLLHDLRTRPDGTVQSSAAFYHNGASYGAHARHT